MNHTYPRGSIWRRWDLHLHTPETKKNPNFNGSSIEEQWDNFYKTIHEYVGDGSDPLKAIAAIGVTDYLSIDNYFKIKNEKKLPGCVKLLIPNIEARMTPIAKDAPINIHFLFDPSFDSQIESQFLANLYFKTPNDKFYATKPELVRLGRMHKNNPSLPESEAYKEGIDQFVLEPESIREVFKDKKELRDKVIIIVSNSSGDGASGARSHSDYLTESGSSQLGETIDAVYQLADCVFSSNPSDKGYFLGLTKETEDVILKRYGSLLPCVHGCDAHENKKIFAPDGERYCWIKSTSGMLIANCPFVSK